MAIPNRHFGIELEIIRKRGFSAHDLAEKIGARETWDANAFALRITG